MSSLNEKSRILLSNPQRKRGCTDSASLVIFLLFWVGMIVISTLSVHHGDAFKLLYGYDSFGNTCDEDNSGKNIPNVSLSGRNLKGRPYLFFMDIANPDESVAVCVNTCPDRELKNIGEIYEYSQRAGSYFCTYDIDIDSYRLSNKSKNGPCPVTPVPKSVPLLNRCVPAELNKMSPTSLHTIITILNPNDVFQRVLTDLYKSWKEMFGLCFVACAFSFLMVLLLRYLPSIMVWLLLTIAVLASLAFTSFLWWTYADIRNKLVYKENLKIPLLVIENDSQQTFLLFAIIATILTIVLFLVILVIRKRFSLVVSLLQEASKCLAPMPCLLLQPLWTGIMLFLFFIYWIIVLAFICTSYKVKVNKHGHVKYEESEIVSYFWWYHFIGLVWTSEFFVACQQISVCGTVARYYFSRDKENINCNKCRNICNIVCHHLGSVTIGAAVLTMVKLPRLTLKHIRNKVEKSHNHFAQYCQQCCTCCFRCLDKCLRYLNTNAYLVVTAGGLNFFTSARKAYYIMMSTSVRITALNGVSDFVLFIGKIGVTCATGAVAVIWLKSRSDLHNFAIPVLLCCILAYYFAHCFLSLFGSVIDALLLCFCEDCNINDGSSDSPYFASKSLMLCVTNCSKLLGEIKKPTRQEEPTQV